MTTSCIGYRGKPNACPKKIKKVRGWLRCKSCAMEERRIRNNASWRKNWPKYKKQRAAKK